MLAAILGSVAACGRKGEITDMVPPPPDAPPPASTAPKAKEPAG
jgi:hypothetical protein